MSLYILEITVTPQSYSSDLSLFHLRFFISHHAMQAHSTVTLALVRDLGSPKSRRSIATGYMTTQSLSFCPVFSLALLLFLIFVPFLGGATSIGVPPLAAAR